MAGDLVSVSLTTKKLSIRSCRLACSLALNRTLHLHYTLGMTSSHMYKMTSSEYEESTIEYNRTEHCIGIYIKDDIITQV